MKPGWIFFLLLIACKANAQHTYLRSYPPVLKEEVYEYRFKGKKIKDSVLTTTTYCQYDKAGNIVGEFQFEKERKNFAAEYTYDSSKRIIRMAIMKYSPHPNYRDVYSNSICEYTYDSLGRLAISATVDDRSGVSVYKYVYGSLNHLQTLLNKSRSDTFYMYQKYFYDHLDSLTGIEEYYEDGMKKNIYRYEYDTLSQIRSIYFSDLDKEGLISQTIYDSLNRIVSHDFWHKRSSLNYFPPDPLDGRSEYYYLTAGPLNYTQFYEKGKLKNMRKIFYK